MKKLVSIQLARAVAVSSVFLFHLTGLSVEYQHGCFYLPWTQVLRAGVDVFFVISGVVMVVTTDRRLQETGTGKRFLIHRVSRIYPPYLLLTAILTVFWAVRPAAINSHGGVDLFSSYTLWPSARLPLVPVGWTLSLEMMFYLVFFCIITSVKKVWLPRALILWSIAVITGSTAIALDRSGTMLRVFPKATFVFSLYVLEFVSGCFIGIARLKVKLAAGRASVLVALTVFVLQAVLFQVIDFDGNNKAALRVLLFGLPSALLVLGLLAWEEERGSLRPPHWVIRCGDMSYSIYLVHVPVIHFAYRYAWKMCDHTGVRPLFMVFTTGLVIGVGVIFYKLVERPFSLWTRIRLEDIFRVPAKMPIVSLGKNAEGEFS